MKSLAMILTTLVVFGFNSERSFCDCWKEGYVEGWCLDQLPGGCITPVVPICPIPPVGRNTCKDGYNLGVTAGARDYRERQ